MMTYSTTLCPSHTFLYNQNLFDPLICELPILVENGIPKKAMVLYAVNQDYVLGYLMIAFHTKITILFSIHFNDIYVDCY